eukprot:scaffold2912_cov129-Isochrysis_galbana.AAC.3
MLTLQHVDGLLRQRHEADDALVLCAILRRGAVRGAGRGAGSCSCRRSVWSFAAKADGQLRRMSPYLRLTTAVRRPRQALSILSRDSRGPLSRVSTYAHTDDDTIRRLPVSRGRLSRVLLVQRVCQ